MVHVEGNSRFENERDREWSEFNIRFQQLFNMRAISEENKRAIFLAMCADFYDEKVINDGAGGEIIASDLHRRSRHGHHRVHPRHRHHRHRGHDFHRFCELRGRFSHLAADRH